jgi:hypothetical protein
MFCTPGHYPQVAYTIFSWGKCPWFLAYVPQGAQSPWLRTRGSDLNVSYSEVGNRHGTVVYVPVSGVLPVTGWTCVSSPVNVVKVLPRLSLSAKHWGDWTLTGLPWTMMEYWCCVRLWVTMTVPWRHLGEWMLHTMAVSDSKVKFISCLFALPWPDGHWVESSLLWELPCTVGAEGLPCPLPTCQMPTPSPSTWDHQKHLWALTDIL